MGYAGAEISVLMPKANRLLLAPRRRWNGHAANNVGGIVIGRRELKEWMLQHVRQLVTKSQRRSFRQRRHTPALACLALPVPLSNLVAPSFWIDNGWSSRV